MAGPEPSVLPFELTANNEKPGDQNKYFWLIIDGQRKYLQVDKDTYDAKTFSSTVRWLPALLTQINKKNEWNDAQVSKHKSTGDLSIDSIQVPVIGISNIWHPKLIDLYDLINPVAISDNVFEATYYPVPISPFSPGVSSSSKAISGPRVIVKIALHSDEVPYMRNKTEMYKFLAAANSTLCPKFLGHVHERGHVIGFALEKVEHAHQISSLDDLPYCHSALEQFHALGFMHGRAAVNHHFLVTGTGHNKRARLISFGRTSKCTDDNTEWRKELKKEMDSFKTLEREFEEEQANQKKEK
ncbi:hypothetical protein KEM56_004365 [Ascosphaera pollenicola]|nr:hypothetical protein KEM56_004365 [Ascosphaera pollenicola]